MRRLVRGGVVALLVVAVVAGGLYVWALASTDSSTVARAMVWRDADVFDLDRFPSRVIAAPDTPTDLPDCSEQEDATELVGSVLESTDSRGFLVLREGCVLSEWYADGVDADTLLTSFSVAKSVLATLVGIALQRGDLDSLDEPLTEHVPELGDGADAITLRDLMAMESGLRYEEAGLPWSDDAETYYSPDLRATALSAEVVEEPGTRWLYNNFNPLLMGLVLERATGTTVAAYAEEHLWGPLGAEHDASWSLDSEASGLEKLESGFNATLRDWGRFALLALHHGQVGGAQVADPAFWTEATEPTSGDTVSPHYGLWWWLEDDGAFMARGNKGQFLYVDPDTEVVVARFGEDFGIEDWPDVLARTAEQVTRED